MLFSHATATYFYTPNNSDTEEEERKSNVTFAIEPVGDGSYRYSAAWCAPGDNFSKKIGRAIASGRFRAGITTHVVPREVTRTNILNTVFADAMGFGPSRWMITDISSSHQPASHSTPTV